MPHRPLEHGENFSFELTGDRGAALVTRHRTYSKDTPLESTFEQYTQSHYKSWAEFARDKGYGNDIQPVLVSGFDVTRDFAMVAYSNEGAFLKSNSTIAVPMFASTPPPFRGTWRTRLPPYTNDGPQQYIPTSRERAIDFPSSQLAGAGGIPDGFNHCVFVRYYTMRSRKWMPMFPEVIRASAGPHDLGSGDNRGDTFPELAVQYGAEPMVGSDGNLGDHWGPTADGTDSEPDIVVRNTPSVWFLSCPLTPL